MPATFFLNSRWVAANPQLAAEFIAEPLFRVENHGTRHVPLSVDGRAAYGIAGTASIDEARDEILGNKGTLEQQFRHPTSWFRSGTAHYDDVSVEMARRLGVQIAGFAVNADGGATLPQAAVTKAIVEAPSGSIIICHMNQPSSDTAAGVRGALQQIFGEPGHPKPDAGVEFVQLP